MAAETMNIAVNVTATVVNISAKVPGPFKTRVMGSSRACTSLKLLPGQSHLQGCNIVMSLNNLPILG